MSGLPDTVWISMRANDAAKFFASLAQNAAEANGREGAFEERVNAIWNDGGAHVEVIFNNDDMERDEMTGRTIVDFES